MKRDTDLVRDILLAIEADKDEPLGCIALKLPGQSDSKVSYHVMILAEAGLIEALDMSEVSRMDWKPKRLTWRGYEFLDAARSDALWEQAKAETLEHTGGLNFGLLEAVLLSRGKRAVDI